MCCYDGCYTATFALSIIINVICGLLVSGHGAFVNDGENLWGFVIFGLYAALSAGMIYFVVNEIYMNEDTSSSLNWICGMCTVATIGTFVAVLLLVKPKYNEVFHGMLITAIVINLVFLYCTACCYTNFLRFGLDGRRRQRVRRDLEKALPPNDIPTGAAGSNQRSFEQSLAQMVNHVQNNPAQKTYKLYAVGSETPFEVAM